MNEQTDVIQPVELPRSESEKNGKPRPIRIPLVREVRRTSTGERAGFKLKAPLERIPPLP